MRVLNTKSKITVGINGENALSRNGKNLIGFSSYNECKIV
jgi:hypothetical protein